MKLSVVILHYQAEAFLHLNLKSVIRAVENLDAEIIVADNYSSGFDLDKWKKNYPQVRFIKFDKNIGFAAGNNRAVQMAQGKFIALVNPDVVVPENLFEALSDFHSSQKNAGIVGVRLIDGSGNFLPESKRQIPGLISGFSRATGLDKILKFKPFNAYYDGRLKEYESGKTDILVGALMFFRKDDFFQVGGFDERYFMYGEDIDLSYSFLQHGFSNYYAGHLKAIHFKGESTPNTPFYRHHFIQATKLFYEKFYPGRARFVGPMIDWAFKLRPKRKKQNPPIDFSNQPVYLITSEKDSTNGLKKHLPSIKTVESPDVIPKGSRIIFDTNYLSFKDQINRMIAQRGKKHTYRFWLPEKKLLIGSDDAQSKGEVVWLE